MNAKRLALCRQTPEVINSWRMIHDRVARGDHCAQYSKRLPGRGRDENVIYTRVSY